tara:strand:+ start:153 stop:356 length:204 start_codon:yes stop_codon:yes gene_type:complete
MKELEKTHPHQIWWEDLDTIEDLLDERDGEMAKVMAEEKSSSAKVSVKVHTAQEREREEEVALTKFM